MTINRTLNILLHQKWKSSINIFKKDPSMLSSKALEKKTQLRIKLEPHIKLEAQTKYKIQQDLYRKRRFEIYFRYKNRKSL